MKKIIFLAILLLSLTLVLAQSEIDWDNTNWKELDYSSAGIYDDDRFYENLPYEAYSKLDYTQVNYDKLDQTIINSYKYLKDFGCNDCYVDSWSSEFRFENGKMTLGTNVISLPGNYPDGTIFHASRHFEVTFPKGTTKIKLNPEENIKIITNGPIEISQGIILNGKITYEKGKYYIRNGDDCTLNGYEFGPLNKGNLHYLEKDIIDWIDHDIEISFTNDCKEKVDKICFYDDKIKITSSLESKVGIKKEQLRISVETGNLLTITEGEILKIENTYKHGHIKLKGQMPSKKYVDGKTIIENGKLNIIIEGLNYFSIKKSFLYDPYDNKVPMIIKSISPINLYENYNKFFSLVVEKDGKVYIKDQKGNKLVGLNQDKPNGWNKNKDWLIDYMDSPKYKDLISRELFGKDFQKINKKNKEKILNEINTRKDKSKEAKFDGFIIKNEISGETMPGTDNHISIDPIDGNKEVVLHELSHESTDGNKRIGINAKEKINEFIKKNIKNKGNKVEGILYQSEYYTDYTEIQARLTVTRKLLQEKGDFDPFTEEFDLKKHWKSFKKIEDSNTQDLKNTFTPKQIEWLMNNMAYQPIYEDENIAYS